jgi:hypothetical protein
MKQRALRNGMSTNVLMLGGSGSKETVNAQKQYYLSEMAVSAGHGGGLTLQRILRDDLKQFDSFFHIDDFATRVCPIIDELKERQVNLHELYPSKQVEEGSFRYYRDRAFRALVRLKLRRRFDREADRRIRLFAEHILNNFEVGNSRWLVIPQNTTSVLLLNRLFRRRRFDYITWMMDDHVIRWNDGWQYPGGFEEEFSFHLKNARRVLVISGVMAQLYKERFGIESDILFGPADPISPPVYESPNPSGPVRLCYFGAIRTWQRDALEELALRLPMLNATLDLFAFHDPPASLRGGYIRVCPVVPAEEVMVRMREYDGVVIPASFDEKHRSLTELNVATKLSECLASGSITVLVGPEYGAMVRFVREHGGGIVISNFDDSKQLAAIGSLKERSFREELLNQARNTVNTVCSVNAMRNIWRKHWSEVASFFPTGDQSLDGRLQDDLRV